VQLTRTIYRCSYFFKAFLGPVRDSKAFPTEQEARKCAEDLKASGYSVTVWRELQVKTRGRWVSDLDAETTQPLDP
jgi:hypothetical protein